MPFNDTRNITLDCLTELPKVVTVVEILAYKRAILQTHLVCPSSLVAEVGFV